MSSLSPKPRKPGIFGNPAALFAVIVAILVALSVAHHSHAATPYPDVTTERFSVSVSGDGPDVVLIPGLGSSAAVWDGTVARFKGHYRLHVLNLAGFAGEPAGANAAGNVIAPSVEALDGYIRANHLQHPIIVGHSMGGLMALMLAKAHPEDTGKLVIVDALPFVGLIFDPNATVAGLMPQAAAMRDGMMATPADAFAAQQKQGTARLVSKPGDIDTVTGWSVASDRRVFAQSFFDDLTTDLRADLATLKTPAVVIVPVASQYGQTADAALGTYRAAYAGMPAVSFVPVDASLHFVMLDQPEPFAVALEGALK